MACAARWAACSLITDGFVRHETIFQTEDGVVTRRTDTGTVASTSETGVEYTLATGETASVTTDDTTEIVTLGTETVELGNSGRTRDRLVPETVALADVAAGTEVIVWSESQADGSFLAQRIVVRPAVVATDDATTEDASGSDAGSRDHRGARLTGARRRLTRSSSPPRPADRRAPARRSVCQSRSARPRDLQGLDVVGQLEAPHLGVEGELCLQRSPPVGGLAEAVALPSKSR